jgi:enoyl-CoA hydratase
VSTALLVQDEGAVRILTLNRPHSRNALDGELITALYAGLLAADADPDVRAVVLTGTDPAFCAGIDLKQAASEGEVYFQRHRTEPCITQVALLKTPIIGAINGPTFAGGLEMALGCDFLIASELAAFADTHARVGVLPGGGMTARLPALVGQAQARRLSFTGEVIDAGEALRIGLVTEVVAHDALLIRALEVANEIAEVTPETMALLKGIYSAGANSALQAAMAAERANSASNRPDVSTLDERRVEITARNRRQLPS